MLQDQSQPQQQPQYLTSPGQLQQAQAPQCIQQTDSNLSAASYHSSGGASDEHPVHSAEQVTAVLVTHLYTSPVQPLYKHAVHIMVEVT